MSLPTLKSKPPVRERVLQQAREHLFTFGYSAFTMDKLANALGMSKKTLYVHFPNKEAIIIATIEAFSAGVRSEAATILRQPRITFVEKLRALALTMAEKLARLRPEVFRDIQRSAPHIHQHIVEVRRKTLIETFGQFIEDGQISGAIRDHLNPTFAAEFYMHAMQGMMDAATLERHKLTPAETFDLAIRIFYNGLLTPKGQNEYDQYFPL